MARVSGPGRYARRTDKDRPQPIRTPTGQPYGSAKQVEAMQQAVHLPQEALGAPQGGAGAPQMPAGQVSGQTPPADLVGLLGHGGTQRPDEPITAPAPPEPTMTQQTAGDLAMEIEKMIQENGGRVPSAVLQLYYNLRTESNMSQPTPFLSR